jgi:hydroxyethylthiazole kinase-like uncharacterized protein yjeF
MLGAHTVATIRAAEKRSGADVGHAELMRRASAGLAEVIAARVPEGETILVLVGPGDNGGDALLAAALLAERGRPTNLLVLDRDRVHPQGLAAALGAGAREVEAPHGHRYCVDGLFGIGARPGLAGSALRWREWQAEEQPFTVAVDVPSGIDVDGGTAGLPAFAADVTVSFGALKPGLLLGPAAELAGRIELVDIGLETSSSCALAGAAMRKTDAPARAMAAIRAERERRL